MDAHVSRIRHESRIHVEDGDVHLKLSDSYPIKISIDANDIITDSKLGEHGKVRLWRRSWPMDPPPQFIYVRDTFCNDAELYTFFIAVRE